MTSNKFKVEHLNEFDKDLKKLSKKYRHLDNDVKRAIHAIIVDGPCSFHGSERLNNLGKGITLPIYKLKKFRSMDVKGKGSRSGFRLIYAYDQTLNKLILIEIYFHERKDSNYDKQRILNNFKKTIIK